MRWTVNCSIREEITGAVEGHSTRFMHVQIADVSSRHEPGMVEIAVEGHPDWSIRATCAGFDGLGYVAATDDPFSWLSTSGRSLPAGHRS